VAAGEIEWRAHIDDLNVAVLHFFARLGGGDAVE
jgi:hypothetical protein